MCTAEEHVNARRRRALCAQDFAYRSLNLISQTTSNCALGRRMPLCVSTRKRIIGRTYYRSCRMSFMSTSSGARLTVANSATPITYLSSVSTNRLLSQGKGTRPWWRHHPPRFCVGQGWTGKPIHAGPLSRGVAAVKSVWQALPAHSLLQF